MTPKNAATKSTNSNHVWITSQPRDLAREFAESSIPKTFPAAAIRHSVWASGASSSSSVSVGETA